MFNDLTPNDYNKLSKFFIPQTHMLCYYSLSSLIAWSHHLSKPVWKIENDVLIAGMVFFSEPEKNYLLLPIANGQELSPSQLYNIGKNNGFNQYQFIPEAYVTGHNYSDINNLFVITEQPGFQDYIYKTADLATLKGKKYSKKRNLINQFQKNYINTQVVETMPITTSDIPECIALLNTWTDSKEYDADSSEYTIGEKTAVENALHNIDKLGFSGLQLRINGQIKAFGISSKLTDDIGGFNFEKADPAIKGLYQYFGQQCAQRLFADYKYVNKECDMGDPGLRQAKRSYYPEIEIKSFRLCLQ